MKKICLIVIILLFTNILSKLFSSELIIDVFGKEGYNKFVDRMKKEAEIKQQEEENRQYWTNESEDIHEVMYQMATKNASTTLQLDPIGGSENFQGGSENIHR